MKTTYPLLANRLVYIIKGGGGSSSYLVRASETDMLPGFLSQKIDSTLQIRDNKMGVSGNVFDNFNSAVARIELTQQGLKTQFSDFSDQYQTFSSSFEQTAKGFAMAVYSQEIDKFSGKISEKYSTREQTADYIKDLVSNTTLDQYKNVVSQNYSTREQTATLISDQVYAAVFHPDTGVRSEMMSAINQTASNIEMYVEGSLYGPNGIESSYLSKIEIAKGLIRSEVSETLYGEDGKGGIVAEYRTGITQTTRDINLAVERLEGVEITTSEIKLSIDSIDLGLYTNGKLDAGILIQRINEDTTIKIAASKVEINGSTTFAAGYNPYAIQAELAQYKTDNDATVSSLQTNFSAINEDQQTLYQNLQSQGNQIVTLDGKYTAVATKQGTLSNQYGVLNGQVVDLTDIVNGHAQAILTINGQTIPAMNTDIGTANNAIESIINNIEGEGGINSVLQTLNTDFNALSEEVAYEIHDLNGTLFTQINNLANRKNTRYVSATEPVPPTGVNFRIGDEWVKEIEVIEEGETTYEYESYMWFGTEWRPNLTTIDGARITTGVIDAARIIATELFAQEIGAVNLHVAQGFVGGFKINNMLVAESEDGKGISIDPTKREILIKDLQEGLGISQVSIRAGDLTPEAELNVSGGIGFKSSVTSNELNIRNSDGSEITSRDIRATDGVTVRQYVCSGGLNKAKLKSTLPDVKTRFVIEVGKNYVADLPYNFRIYHNLGRRNGRSHKLHGDLKVTITSRLIGRTAGGVTKELVAAAPVITNISRSTRETTMFERPVTRKVSFYSIDCTTAYWEIDVKLEGDLTYQQWTNQGFWNYYWMTSTYFGIDYRGVIPDGCTISPSMGIMEMTTSGFQFMWGSGRFFKIDGRDLNHFITSQGKWVHDGDFQLNGSDIVTIDNVSSAIASDLSAYATKNYVDTGFYTKSQSKDLFALKGGSSTQDFIVKNLIIHGQIDHWVGQTLVVADARVRLNRKEGAATIASGLDVGENGTVISSLEYTTGNRWQAGGQNIATENWVKNWVENSATAYNSARLGNYPASDYARKGQNEIITGKWSFNDNVVLRGDKNTLALYYNIDGVAKSRVNEIILGREPDFHKWRILNQSTSAWGNTPDLSFQYLSGTGSVYADVLTMTYGRNVGINQTNPTEKLHVVGNGLFTGNLTANNGTFNEKVTAQKGILSSLDVSGISTLQGEAILGDKLRVAKEGFFSEKIQAANAVSQLTGWQISKDGAADFRHIYTDELQAKAFTADISQALVGSDILTKSVAKLAQDFVVASSGQTSLFVEELEGFPEMQVFAVNDMLRLRVFDRGGGGLLIKDVWVKVNSYVGTAKNVQEFKVTTVVNGGVVGKPIYKGSMVLDYGISGSGVIERTVLDAQGSPYSRVVTWGRNTDGTVDVKANPWDNTKKFLHYQSGNLEGIANCSGWGVYSQNSFLTGKIVVGDLTKSNNYMEYNPVDGLTIKGKITVTGGNVATKQDIDDLQVGGRNLILGTTDGIISISSSGTSNESELFSTPINHNARIGGGIPITLSFEAKTTGNLKPSNVYILPEGWSTIGTVSVRVTYTSEWKKYTYVLTTPSGWGSDGDPLAKPALRFNHDGSTDGNLATLYLRKVKLELGNRATDWTPAPEDVQAYTDALTTRVEDRLGLAQLESINETLITNNKIRTSLLEVKDIVAQGITAGHVEGLTLNFTKGKIAGISFDDSKLFTNRWELNKNGDASFSGSLTVGDLTGQHLHYSNGELTIKGKIIVQGSGSNVATSEDLDNLEIGGTNLLKNTTSGVGWNKTGFDAETRTFTRETTGTSECFVILNKPTRLENNTTYTLSAWIKSNGQVKNVEYFVYNKSISKIHKKSGIEATTNWQFVTFTFTTDSSTDYSESTIRFDNNGSKIAGVNAILYVKEPKLERGNKATDWSPAPEDVPSALDYLATAIQDGSTDIEGGLVSTNVLMVKDTAGTVRGGMSGLKTDNVGFWTGGTYQQALENLAKVIFRKDGSGQLAGGLIKFLENGNLQVGDFDIGGDGTLLIKDGNDDRVMITKGNITTLAGIAANTQDNVYSHGGANISALSTTTVTLTGNITVTNPLSYVTVTGMLSTKITRPASDPSFIAYTLIKVSLIRWEDMSVVRTTRDQWVHPIGSGVKSFSGPLDMLGVLVQLAGTYRIQVEFNHVVNGPSTGFKFYSVASGFSTHVVYDGAKRITEIGKNGVGILADKNNYSFFGVEGGVYKIVEKISNTAHYDKPGLLLSGIKWGSGFVSFYFGSYGRIGSFKSGSDEYQINHAIGHTDYTVILTSITTYRQWWVTEKTSTYFRIKMNSTLETQCEFAVFGNNK